MLFNCHIIVWSISLNKLPASSILRWVHLPLIKYLINNNNCVFKSQEVHVPCSNFSFSFTIDFFFLPMDLNTKWKKKWNLTSHKYCNMIEDEKDSLWKVFTCEIVTPIVMEKDLHFFPFISSNIGVMVTSRALRGEEIFFGWFAQNKDYQIITQVVPRFLDWFLAENVKIVLVNKIIKLSCAWLKALYFFIPCHQFSFVYIQIIPSTRSINMC